MAKSDYVVMNNSKSHYFKDWGKCQSFISSTPGLKITRGFNSLGEAEKWVRDKTNRIDYNLKKKVKITKEGQPCRKCRTPVKKFIPKTRKGKAYYFKWYFRCENCKTMYMVEEAKVYR